MLDQATIDRFLAGEHLAVVGASDEKASFGRTVYQALPRAACLVRSRAGL